MRPSDTYTGAARDKIIARFSPGVPFSAAEVYDIGRELRARYFIKDSGADATLRCTLQRMAREDEVIFLDRGWYMLPVNGVSWKVPDSVKNGLFSAKSAGICAPMTTQQPPMAARRATMLDVTKGRRSASTSESANEDNEALIPSISTFIYLDPRETIVPPYHAHRDPEHNPQRRAELDGYAKAHGGYNLLVARPGLLNQRRPGGKFYVVDGVGRRDIAIRYPDSETKQPVGDIRWELLTAHLDELKEFELFLDIGKSVRPTSPADLFVGLAKQGHLPEQEQYEVLCSTGFQLPGSGARGVPHITLQGLAFGWGPPKGGMSKEERREPKNANVLRRGLYILKNTSWAKGEAVKAPGRNKKPVPVRGSGTLATTNIVAVFAFMKAFPNFDEARLRLILNETSAEALRHDGRDWLRAHGYQQNSRFVAYRVALGLVEAYCHGLKALPRLDPDALKFETTAHDVYNAFPKKVIVAA
jgi:hypothetical protein